MRTLNRIAALFCALCLCFICTAAHADLRWPQLKTAGMEALRDYITELNSALSDQNAPTVNSLFECYTYNASLGITDWDDAEIPEDVELTFTMTESGLETLVLRSTRLNTFTTLAAACIHAASPHITTLQDAMKEPAIYVKKATQSPDNSFADNVITLQGANPRLYWAYYPNQYHDGRSWIQMTLIFPIAGAGESGVYTTPAPADKVIDDPEHEGYLPLEAGEHMEVFFTATPEPDSPAAEK